MLPVGGEAPRKEAPKFFPHTALVVLIAEGPSLTE